VPLDKRALHDNMGDARGTVFFTYGALLRASSKHDAMRAPSPALPPKHMAP